MLHSNAQAKNDKSRDQDEWELEMERVLVDKGKLPTKAVQDDENERYERR